jgi:hypothetical protein
MREAVREKEKRREESLPEAGPGEAGQADRYDGRKIADQVERFRAGESR